VRKHYLFAEDPSTGHAQQIPIDAGHVDRQMAVLRADGQNPVLMDAEERLDMALLTRDLIDAVRAAGDEPIICHRER
jgi:hypothetical protein